MSKQTLKPRNYLYNHPLLRKGGVHEKSKKTIRRQDKAKLKKEWLSKNRFYQLIKVFFR